MTITCITFDLDDTLWESGPVLENAEVRLYEWIGRTCPDIAHTLPYDALVAHRHAHYATIPEIRHDLTRARISWLESLLREWGYASELAETGFRVFREHRNAVTLFDDAARVLGELGERFAVGAITNGNADVNHIGIGHLFDFVVTPARAGAAKPESAIFELALSTAGARPESAVHVGDDPMRDIAGAAALGIRTVWMNPQGREWPLASQPDAEIRSLRRPRFRHRRLELTARHSRTVPGAIRLRMLRHSSDARAAGADYPHSRVRLQRSRPALRQSATNEEECHAYVEASGDGHVAFVLASLAFAAEPADPVDINTASAETLAAAIHGVGLKRAQAIVLYREQHGAFSSIDQLAEVRGISTRTVERNRDRLTVGDDTD